MKVGDLIKRTHQPYDYGIIQRMTKHSIFVYWAGGYISGYCYTNWWLSCEILDAGG